MDRNFCITLTFACHRVADVLPEDGAVVRSCIKDSANRVLADLLILAEKNPVTAEQKHSIAPRLLQEIEILYGYFRQGREGSWIDADNFLVLEQEYNKVRAQATGFLQEPSAVQEEQSFPQEEAKGFARAQFQGAAQEIHSSQNPVGGDYPSGERPQLNARQGKILGLLKTKERLQVWEAQKFMPEVTKRTLRRDFDDLIKKELIERAGQWNTVSYRLRKPVS